MFNIGFGEILLIAVLGLLVFGPDRLPEAVRRAAEVLRQVRSMAGEARQHVVDAAGLDHDDTASVVQDLRDLHPQRMASAVLKPIMDPHPGPSTAPARSEGIDPDLA